MLTVLWRQYVRWHKKRCSISEMKWCFRCDSFFHYAIPLIADIIWLAWFIFCIWKGLASW